VRRVKSLATSGPLSAETAIGFCHGVASWHGGRDN